MKKITFWKSFFLLFALIVGSTSVWADGSSTANFDASKQTDTGTSSYYSLSYTVDDVKIDATKARLSSSQLRLYASQSSKMTISQVGTSDKKNFRITKIEFTYSGSDTNLTTTTGTLSSDKLTWTGSATSIEFSVASSKKAFIKTMAITYEYDASDDPSSSVAFENPTPSLDLKNASTYTQTATTASGYAGTTGASVTYEMTANTAGATINESTGEVSPTQAGSVTVKATAAAIEGSFAASSATYTLTVTDTRKFTITCHIGNNTNDVERNSGATLSLDDPAAIGGMSFVGWSSSNDTASPVWVANTSKVTGNMEVYAFFEEVAGEYSYHLVEADQSDWRGDYLIAYSNNVFANGKENGTSGIGSSSTTVKPGSYLDGKVIDSSWGDQYYISLEAIDDADLSKGYVLKTQDDYYNYHTSNTNNGINGTSKNKSTAASYPITVNYVSSSEINLKLNQGQVFRYNSNEAYFRYYKSSSYSDQGKVYLYKRTTDVEPVYSLGETATFSINSACTDGEKYFGTYSNSKAFVVPSGLTVSTVGISAGKLVVTDYATGDIVKANTGVMVSSSSAGEKTIVLSASTGTEKDGNLLKPSGGAGITAANMNEANTLFYRLTMHNGTQIGYWWGAANGGAFGLGANKAYLAVPTAPAARMSGFTFDNTTTGINGVEEIAPVTKTRKVVKNGCLVIETANGEFTISGARVK